MKRMALGLKGRWRGWGLMVKDMSWIEETERQRSKSKAAEYREETREERWWQEGGVCGVTEGWRERGRWTKGEEGAEGFIKISVSVLSLALLTPLLSLLPLSCLLQRLG